MIIRDSKLHSQQITSSMIDVSTIIVSYNTENLLRECMAKLRTTTQGLAGDIIFVDNASKDSSVDVIRSDFSDCRLIANAQNVGFGRANNQAVPFAEGRYVLLLNTDAFVAPDTLVKTVAYMDAHPKCGILGVRLVGRDGVLQPSCRYFPTVWNTFLLRTGLDKFFTSVRMVDDLAWAHDEVRSCDWVVGCYYLVRREVIQQVGLFDPRYFLYFEEVDHCFAAKKAGWEIVFYPHTTVIHLGGESAKSDGSITESGRQLEALQVESELLYFRKNHGAALAWVNVVLTVLADWINVLKRVVRLTRPFGVAGAWRHSALVCGTYARTRWANQPTR